MDLNATKESEEEASVLKFPDFENEIYHHSIFSEFTELGDENENQVRSDILSEQVIGESVLAKSYNIQDEDKKLMKAQIQTEIKKQELTDSNRMYQHILPRPDSSSFQCNAIPEPANLAKPKRKRGTYKCKYCNSEKKFHQCSDVTSLYDKEIQTAASGKMEVDDDPKVSSSGKVVNISVSERFCESSL